MQDRGFLTDIGKVIDVIQDLVVKVEILTTKVEEALNLIKDKNNDGNN